MTKISIQYLFFFFVLLCFLQPAIGAERVYLDITASEARKINMAVPWFQNKGLPQQKQTLGRQLADTDGLNAQLKKVKSPYLINLASNEYFKAVKPKALNGEIITPAFKELKNGDYK